MEQKQKQQSGSASAFCHLMMPAITNFFNSVNFFSIKLCAYALGPSTSVRHTVLISYKQNREKKMLTIIMLKYKEALPNSV